MPQNCPTQWVSGEKCDRLVGHLSMEWLLLAALAAGRLRTPAAGLAHCLWLALAPTRR